MIFNPTSRARVRDAETHWIPKSLLRIVTIISGLIATGLIAWAFTKSDFYDNAGFDYNSRFLLPWEFITLGISILWNLANVLVRLSRPRPMHPGANVALDLLLWMGLLITGLFALLAGIQNSNFSPALVAEETQSSQPIHNPDGSISYVYGNYGHFPNGTYGFIPEGTPGVCPGFSSCAESNMVLAMVKRLARVEIAGASFTFLAVLLHFTLFVWACVDVHRRNDTETTRRATKIAQTLIAEMTDRGVLLLPTQQSSQLNPQQQQQQQRAPLLAADGTPMDELSRGGSAEGMAVDREVVNGGDKDVRFGAGSYSNQQRIGHSDEIRAANGVLFPVDNLGVHPARR